jgi:hypothetical protein
VRDRRLISPCLTQLDNISPILRDDDGLRSSSYTMHLSHVDRSSAYYACNKELRTICHRASNDTQLVACLYDHKHSVSQKCAEFALGTTAGACEEASNNLCGSHSLIDDVMTCLRNAVGIVSQRCQVNVHRYGSDGSDSLAGIVYKNNESRIQLVSTMTALYLLLMIGFTVWTCRWRVYLQRKAHKLRAEEGNSLQIVDVSITHGAQEHDLGRRVVAATQVSCSSDAAQRRFDRVSSSGVLSVLR